ncbi:hypothetical protein JQ544_25395 [Bradyrhizobium diazoefficiens]|nr:hypothetical protein [Bradyrhizobium diazoefficiens]MBR0814889.1 hypothetical protein [Bradyrhizobium diazoefficiens]
MSDMLRKLLQRPPEPSPEAKLPQWIADALAHKPEKLAPVVDSTLQGSLVGNQRTTQRSVIEPSIQYLKL